MKEIRWQLSERIGMKRASRVTFDDIAKYTGFSKTTISRYFNNPDSLTLENQEKIAAALKELHYQENKVGRILASGRTEMIGLIIPNLYMHYYAEMLNRFLATYSTYGYKFLVFEGNQDEDTERKYIKELIAYNVEGMIVLSHTIPSKELAGYHIPLVTIEREDEYVSSVNTDNLMGGIQATSVLCRSGCEELFFIDARESSSPSVGRETGFEQVCSEYRIPHQVLILDLKSGYEGNYRGIADAVDDITARCQGKRKGIFCANDTYADMVSTHLLRRFGEIPDDFRIIGFDGSPVSEQAVVPFSTVGQQTDKMVEAAMELLTEQIRNRSKRAPVETPIRHKVITPVLICRGNLCPEVSPRLKKAATEDSMHK